MLNPSGDAPWTQDEATFCNFLRTRFGDRVVFRRFAWSGGNSHTARSKAAESLREYLREGLQDWPDDTHVIVAHSHGGNVVLSALNAFNLRGKIAGVACLATPFISAQERDLGKGQSGNTELSGLSGTIFLSTLLMTVLGLHTWFGSWSTLDLYNKLLFVGLQVVLIIFVVMPVGFLTLGGRASYYARKLCDELTSLPPNKFQFLIIRSPADEASGAFALFQFISQVTVRVFLLAEVRYARIQNLVQRLKERTRMIRYISIGGFVLCFVLVFWPPAAALFPWVWPMILAGLFVTFLVFGAEMLSYALQTMLGAFVWLVITVLSILLVVPFGWQAALANFLLDISFTNLFSWRQLQWATGKFIWFPPPQVKS